MKQILLVETLNSQRYRHQGAEYFPFVLSLAHELNWQGTWVSMFVPDNYMHIGASFIFDLPSDQRDLLSCKLDSLNPNVIVFHDRPTDELKEMLRSVVAGVRIVDLTEPFSQYGYHSMPISPYTLTSDLAYHLFAHGKSYDCGDKKELFLETIQPLFVRRSVLARQDTLALRKSIRILVDPGCSYRRPIKNNRFYKGLSSEGLEEHNGCAFCMKQMVDDYNIPQLQTSVASAIEQAICQIEAHQLVEGLQRECFEYIFDYGLISTVFDKFLEVVLEKELYPASFVIMSRADKLLTVRSRLEDLLPRLRKSGHKLNLISIGAENFSMIENERFNKGITPDQLWDCVDLIEDFSQRFPNTFECLDKGYFSAILFTPWTRPEDLKENIKAARRLGHEWLNRVVGSRLQLWPNTPITNLAIQDGLTFDSFEDASSIVATSCSGPADPQEIMWRFVDVHLPLIHQLLIRLEPISEKVHLEVDDALLLEIRKERMLLPDSFAKDYLLLSESLVDAVVALGPDTSIVDLFAHCREQCRQDLQDDEDVQVLIPEKDKQAGFPSLVFQMNTFISGEFSYLFRIFVCRDGRLYFRRVGCLAIEYGGHELNWHAVPFLKALLRTMKCLQTVFPSEYTLPQWKGNVQRSLEQAGIADHFEWSITFEFDNP